MKLLIFLAICVALSRKYSRLSVNDVTRQPLSNARHVGQIDPNQSNFMLRLSKNSFIFEIIMNINLFYLRTSDRQTCVQQPPLGPVVNRLSLFRGHLCKLRNGFLVVMDRWLLFGGGRQLRFDCTGSPRYSRTLYLRIRLLSFQNLSKMDFLSANSGFAVQNLKTYLPQITRETCISFFHFKVLTSYLLA